MAPLRVLNIPNLLTLLRMLLVPVFIYLVVEERTWTALVVFAAAGLTDALDGFIARTFGQKTDLGAYMDPIADKMLLVSAFVALAAKDMIPAWLCALVILRDIVIMVGIKWLELAGRVVRIVPSMAGKVTTVLQISTVVYAMMTAGAPDLLYRALVAVTAAFTVYTGFDYVWREVKIQTGR
ncbi:MAG TPA: CDP-alcohol phosphatidyltransferase family protein [Deltaproteobacteria bacterium]|nr:CDP-alcohol phosphatidyltransferase family protein [Deltaproteobacteria bacterium]